MHDLFLSYATADRALAENVRDAQKQRGISCWMAPEDVGAGDYGAAINKAISEAKAFVVILSEAAAASEHVVREVSLAADRRRPILPLVFTDYRPEGSLEYFSSGQQYIRCGAAHFEEAMDTVAAITRGAAKPRPRPKHERDLVAILSAISALLAAVTPFPIAAIARIAIVAAALVYPLMRVLSRTRTWPPRRRCAATFLLLLLCGWILDRAALRSVVRKQMDGRLTVILHAPYGDVQGLRVDVPPYIDCAPRASVDVTLYDWDGPTRAMEAARFTHPDTIRVECRAPITLSSKDIKAISKIEVLDYDLYRLLRWLFITIGGLSWAGFCLLFWRRRSSRSK